MHVRGNPKVTACFEEWGSFCVMTVENSRRWRMQRENERCQPTVTRSAELRHGVCAWTIDTRGHAAHDAFGSTSFRFEALRLGRVLGQFVMRLDDDK